MRPCCTNCSTATSPRATSATCPVTAALIDQRTRSPRHHHSMVDRLPVTRLRVPQQTRPGRSLPPLARPDQHRIAVRQLHSNSAAPTANATRSTACTSGAGCAPSDASRSARTAWSSSANTSSMPPPPTPAATAHPPHRSHRRTRQQDRAPATPSAIWAKPGPRSPGHQADGRLGRDGRRRDSHDRRPVGVQSYPDRRSG